MRVLIANRREQKLTKGYPLAHCEPITLVIPPNVEQPQVQDTTPKFQDEMAAARPDFSDAEYRDLEEHLTEYSDIFAMESDDYGRTDRVYQRIDTGEVRPICQPPRRLSLPKRAEVDEMFEDMQGRGLIEE
jgi:hypothetical protein